jgi:exodeoxyribonuclease VII small subunit
MPKELDFETALKKLETIVHQLEQDELPLEEALKTFEEGIKLSRYCAKSLDQAEKRIMELTQNENGEPIWKAWEEDRTE